MKIKKMAGALALTAALAMGTAPAFAAAPAQTDPFSTDGSTDIKAKVENVDPNVRATVPLQVTVVFGTTGGGTITGPTAGAYAITNVGDGPIKLTNIELTDMNSAFTSSAIYYDGSDYTDLGGDPITSGDHIMFTVKTANNFAYIIDGHGAKDQKQIGSDKDAVEQFTGVTAKKWADETIAKEAKLPIELSGLHYFNSTLDSGEMTDTLCKLKCTISG